MQHFQNHREFVSPQSCNAICFTYLRAQTRAKSLQQSITHHMAQTVIDALEMVYVHVQKRHGLFAATTTF